MESIFSECHKWLGRTVCDKKDGWTFCLWLPQKVSKPKNHSTAPAICGITCNKIYVFANNADSTFSKCDKTSFSTRIENIWEKFGTSLLIMQEITFKTPTHALCHFFYKICEGGWANIPFDIGGQGDSIGKSAIGKQHILIWSKYGSVWRQSTDISCQMCHHPV